MAGDVPRNIPWEPHIHASIPSHSLGDPRHCHACALDKVRELERRIDELYGELEVYRSKEAPTDGD